MAQSNLASGNGATTSPYGRREYVISTADFTVLGATSGVTTSGSLLLDIFPSGTYMNAANVEVTTLCAGTSISGVSVQLKYGTTGSESSYGSALDAFTSLTRVVTNTVTAGNIGTTNSLLLGITTTGANVSALNAGVLKVVVNISDPLTV